MRKKQKIKDLKRLTEGNVEREVRSSDRALIFFLSIDSKPINYNINLGSRKSLMASA